jgi:hypothetical protein
MSLVATETGASDVEYDLVLVLQQALEDIVRYSRCARDAHAAHEPEVAHWFEELAASDRQVADQARKFLRERL